MVLDDLEIMIDTMDTDLDLVKLALEQEELTREARIKDQKRKKKWTQFMEYLETLGYIMMASTFIYLNNVWKECMERNKKIRG